MKIEALKSELLLEDSGYNICCFCSSLNIFSNHFDYYCLLSINYFLRNGARNSQKRTFVRRQWAQYLLFLFFTQHLFKSIWSLLFDVNQLFSQKWSPKLSKANFCSKTVGTAFAVFCSSSNIFPNQFDYYCLFSINFFSEIESETLKSELLFEDSGHSICCFRSSLNIFSNQFGHYCLMLNNYFLRNEARNSQKQTFARRQWAQHLLFFCSSSNIFSNQLIIDVWCQLIIFSQMEPETLKSELLFEDSGHSICWFFFSELNISRKLWCRHQ